MQLIESVRSQLPDGPLPFGLACDGSFGFTVQGTHADSDATQMSARIIGLRDLSDMGSSPCWTENGREDWNSNVAKTGPVLPDVIYKCCGNYSDTA
jgi:hypothetical protein